jgi:peptidyl-prolyl cis-trans isomerase B (cyclophilin B)
MKYRIQITLLFVLILAFSHRVFSQKAAYTVLIETNKGNMECILYQETPMHADNFVELSKKGFYDGLLFHRVISDFMIQTGDPDSRAAKKGVMLGYGDSGNKTPAEFHPDLYHRKGVLAAARQGDQMNPGRESNGSQFYIVQGKIFTDEELNVMEAGGGHIAFTQEQRMYYTTIGGTPHLDYAYTVFGEVTEGLDVIDKIAYVQTDGNNRPIEDVMIIKITVLK